MSKFKIGDRALIVSSDNPVYNHLIGEECVISRIGSQKKPEAHYEIDCCNEYGLPACEHHLQKIPKKQKTTTWDQCAWKPEGVMS